MTTDFIGYLVEQIRAKASHYISMESDDLRVVFSAPPVSMLNEIFQRFETMGPRIKLEHDGHTKLVPVMLIEEGVEDPSHQNTCRCSSNHVVAVRTNYGSYLALIPTNHSLLLSTGTTVNRLGLANLNHVAFDTWKNEDFVANVFRSVISRYENVSSEEVDLVWLALKESFDDSSLASEASDTWELLRSLYDLGGEGKTVQDLLHTLGMPRLDAGQKPDDNINQLIANHLQSHGLSNGIALLKEDTPSEALRTALELFKTDILALYRTAQGFAARPLGNYAKANLKGQNEWWNTLTLSTWKDLLSHENNQETGTLKVSCIEELFRRSLNSQIPVVDKHPRLRLEADEALLGEKLSIYRASGRKTHEFVETITLNSKTVEWTDESSACDHEQYVSYEFTSSKLEKPVKFKLVTLESYLPSVVINCRSAQKIAPFKKKKAGRSRKGRAANPSHYECEIVTNGTGTHTIEFFYRTDVSLPSVLEGQVGEAENQSPVTWHLTTSAAREGYAVAVIEITGESQAEFKLDLSWLDSPVRYVLCFSHNEFTTKGASSEFNKLVINNCNPASNVTQVDVQQSMLTLLEQWILENKESYNPLILGPGFKDCWRQPEWAEHPQLSNLKLSVDPRPRANELSPPKDYLEARERARELLNKLCEDQGSSIEALSLGLITLDQNNLNVIESYIREYANWLYTKDSMAAWSDLITVHKAQQHGQYLESKPIALLLSPMHPIRLAWQCNAQQLLQEAMQDGIPCPVAAIIDPSSFPDCIALKCRDMNGSFNPIGFASIKSSADYWSVLWRSDAISEASQANEIGVFGYELGLKIEGMVNGFNKQQVKRSLDDIRQLYPAKSRLRVSLHSDSSGYSSCNDGIDEWCLENLGPDVDEWSPAGGLTLQIIDKRPQEEQPESAVLASLTERSGTKVRWYANGDKTSGMKRDLSIVDHLQTMDQEFRKDGMRSPVDPSCLSRVSIKKNAADHLHYLSLSRTGLYVTKPSGNELCDNLSNALDKLESDCVDFANFDSLGFAPNLQTLNGSLEDTRYSAISSSTVDATCFHSPGKDTFLWDYELPRYAPGIGQSSGFYLVAKQSPTMTTAMKNVLGQFCGSANVTNTEVTSLLDEISRRGIPTLKRLTGGGSASMGEAGMLVASRLLQSDFQNGAKGQGLIPTIKNRVVNLVIPVDVFQPRFDELRKALGSSSRERPDLLVLSISFKVDAGDDLYDPNLLKITPIEVKARSSEMNDKQHDEALFQATSFSNFINNLKERGEKSALWGVAYRDLIASWLDYGFRIYGETTVARDNPHWVRYHQQTISSLMSKQVKIEVDPIGRLISIEDTANSRVLSSGDSSTDNIAVINYELASALLSGNQPDVVTKMVERVGDWGLTPDTYKTDKAFASKPPHKHDDLPPDSTSGDENTRDDNNDTAFPDSVISTILHSIPQPSPSIAGSGLSFTIGQTTDLIGNKEVSFNPGNTALNNINIGVVGDLGTGKTQLLKSLIYQMVKSPEKNRGIAPKVLILDYKRDFSDKDDDCLFIDKARVKVVSPYRIPLNLFSTEGDNSKRAMLDKAGFFRDILRKIFKVNAPVQDKNLKEAIKSAYSTCRELYMRDPTIYDVLEQYEMIVDGKPDSASGIMSDMVDYEIFEEDPSKIISFKEFFDGVVAIDLKDLSDDKLKNMVIVIFLNLYYDYMLNIEKKPFLGDEPQTRFIDSYLLVDEAHNIMPYEFEVLSKLLLQGRAFGIGVILASQYFSHFKTQKTDYREPIPSWFIHKVSGVTTRDLDRIGLPNAQDSMVSRIAGLEPFHSLCKTLNWEGEFINEVPFYKLD